jgi:hypothetical protein
LLHCGASARLLAGVPNIAFYQDRTIRSQRDLNDLVDWFGGAQAFKCEREQALLNIEAHQTRRYIQAHEPGMGVSPGREEP